MTYGEHLIARCDQRAPRTPVGFDPDQYLDVVGVIARLLANELGQSSDPRHSLGQPGLASRRPWWSSTAMSW
ncbi:MAG TPA: hypothetical protein VFU43_14090 [Streptosporangiaceae bacterium]|nr:hypothetical protein [Streptosporangiaceae bacterium]